MRRMSTEFNPKTAVRITYVFINNRFNKNKDLYDPYFSSKINRYLLNIKIHHVTND